MLNEMPRYHRIMALKVAIFCLGLCSLTDDDLTIIFRTDPSSDRPTWPAAPG